jgi:GDP-4-dehydro-6-deoxy-D-mannose reductase
LNPERDFIDIEDVARAFYFLALKGKRSSIYNICSGKPNSIATILNTYMELSHRKFRVISDPTLVKENDISIMYGDNEKIQDETGWKPEIGLRESLKRTLDYYRKE